MRRPMGMTFQPRVGEQLESGSPPRARDAGFELVQYETSLGQLVYEWRRGEIPGPQFLTCHLASLWMIEWLERGPDQNASVPSELPLLFRMRGGAERTGSGIAAPSVSHLRECGGPPARARTADDQQR